MFDDALLEAFMTQFYGYGDYDAPLWFVGMEEGGGGSPEEIARRLAAWRERDYRELEDLAEYHHALGISHYFDLPGVLQPTWNELIRVRLSMDGLQPTTEEVRSYQRAQLGRLNSASCLLELLPLPSPGTNRWLFYAQNSRLPYLQSRAAYRMHVQPDRIAHLQQRIANYQPKVVVFYGLEYLAQWRAIAGVELGKAEPGGVVIGRNQDSLYLATKHPAAVGVTNAYYHAIGGLLASLQGFEPA